MFDANNFTIPMVEERDGNRVKVYDIFSLLHKDRIVFIGTPIMDYVAAVVVAQLLHLENEDKRKPISLYINSPGGDITAGLAIRDTMKFIKPDIHTICVGQCASMAAVILAAGTKGKRFSLPSSRILIHQPWSSGGGGQATDIALQAKEILRMRDQLETMLSESTGQPLDKIHTDCERDYIMSPQEAMAYGIIDQVIEKRPDKV
jgi:ATP-dependent Clp protease protease subunit